MMAQPVGVVGASARAAAMSLVRAGFATWAVDLFADRDLQRIAPAVRCTFADYPHRIPALCEQFPPGPVIYSGGLENHSVVVCELAARRELWGNDHAVLEWVRDPFRLASLLRNTPRVLPGDAPTPPTGCWLRKPLHSAGGLGIRFAIANGTESPNTYLQEFIPGTAMSAQFRTAGDSTHLLGATLQLIGEPWLHADGFRYAGNIGPMPLDEALTCELSELGNCLQSKARITGVWGADFVLDDGRVRVIEINPRYSAAMEVLELATRAAVFANDADFSAPQQFVGKAIYFAPQRLTFPERGPWDEEFAVAFDPWRVPEFADIPKPGEIVEAGWPVLTIFAIGDSAEECCARLRVRAAELDGLFTEPMP